LKREQLKPEQREKKKTLNVEDFVDEIDRQLAYLNLKLLSGHSTQRDSVSSETNSSSPTSQRRRAGLLSFFTDGLFGRSTSPRSNKTTKNPEQATPLIQFICSGSLVCDDWHVELREIKKALEKFYELRKVVNRLRWIRKIVGSFKPLRN